MCKTHFIIAFLPVNRLVAVVLLPADADKGLRVEGTLGVAAGLRNLE